jgi:hypothetical protein
MRGPESHSREHLRVIPALLFIVSHVQIVGNAASIPLESQQLTGNICGE